MPSEVVLWGVAILALAAGWLTGWVWHRRRPRARADWPQRWNINARPVFSADERALYNELRAALPQHIILAKLSLLKFCQAADGADARRWFQRLQNLQVSFAVCTSSGAVVSVIDIEAPQKSGAQRAQRMKEAVLEACRIRYIRCRPGQWPHQGLIAPWALGQMGAGGAATGNPLMDVGDQLARKLRQRRAERAARWAESSFAQDSFFAYDSRLDGQPTSAPMPLQASSKRP